MTHPLVSAICITENRPHLLQRAIHCFQLQDYRNKELVILYPVSDSKTAALAHTFQDSTIKFISFDEAMTLGQKRNFAVRASNGDYFCSWDDDDWHHPNRIKEQIECVQRTGKTACALGYILLFNTVTHEAYLSFKRPWEGTLLCRSNVLARGLAYGDRNRGEDSVLVQALLDGNEVSVHGNPTLFIYCFHGENISGKEHWDRNIFRHGKAFSREANELVLRMQQNDHVITLSQQLQHFIDDLII